MFTVKDEVSFGGQFRLQLIHPNKMLHKTLACNHVSFDHEDVVSFVLCCVFAVITRRSTMAIISKMKQVDKRRVNKMFAFARKD